MSNLFKALEHTLSFEGGYSNDPVDHGGATNLGITQATLNRYLLANPSALVYDRVACLTIQDAEKIYRWGYWKFDGVKDQGIATKIFDIGVNMGVGTAVRMVQRIVGADPDGIFGPITLAMVNDWDPKLLMRELIQSSLYKYENNIAKDPTQERFRKGWIKRALAMPPS
jgi:lysozyme family protein